MRQCEDKLNTKTAHFRLPSVAQKRCLLKLPNVPYMQWAIAQTYNEGSMFTQVGAFSFQKQRFHDEILSFFSGQCDHSFHDLSSRHAYLSIYYKSCIQNRKRPTHDLRSSCSCNYSGIINRQLGFLARAELRPGLNPSPCNRQFDFKRICFRGRAEISAQDKIRHVIRPLNRPLPKVMRFYEQILIAVNDQ